ncbi:sensor histidine kinase [Planococcus donghaensis]|uniref:cache domain-containing sensor histidine kinase n=1 Tax=Planococcus donghaensis TaxID=414778 RepID=UPI0013015690|nr:sensor histidine kinase [Planococcus donghaensis]
MSQKEQERLSSVNNQLMYFLQDIEQMSLFFTKDDQVREILSIDDKTPLKKNADYETVNDLFDIVLSVKKWDVNIYLIGLNGDRYFSDEYLPSAYNDIRENWGIFRKAQQAKGSLAWDTNYSVSSFEKKDVVLTAGRSIIDPKTNEKLGYVMIDVKDMSFASLYKPSEVNAKEQFYLLDKQGYLVTSVPSVNESADAVDLAALDRTLSGDSGFMDITWKDKPSILSYYTSDDAEFKLLSIIPLKTVEQQDNLIFNLTWNFALIGIIISAWLAYYLSKTVTRPLYKLMFLMNEVEKGNLNIRFSSKYNDDIGIFGLRFNRMLSRLKSLLQDSYEKQLRLQESEIKALRAQINPHFLYNTLETVNWLARLNGSSDISKIVVSLGDILRYSIRKGNNMVTVKEDLKQLQNYLTIQEFRYRDKFTSQVDIDEEVMERLIPALIIQPLVENAIVHGMESKTEEGTIHIRLRAEASGMQILIEDDGVGVDPETFALISADMVEATSFETLGIGIENVRRRLYLSYGEHFTWSLSTEPGKGTRIEIFIPDHVKEGNSYA